MRAPAPGVVLDHLPEAVAVVAGGCCLPGVLTLPPEPSGLVLLAGVAGAARGDECHRAVAESLSRANFGTLRCDLLTEEEARDPALAGDVLALAERLRAAAAWAGAYPATADLAIGYFAAAARVGPEAQAAPAALVAAAAGGPRPRAVVACGGPSVPPGDLPAAVEAPVLLVIGGRDVGALERAHAVLRQLRGVRRLVAIPGAIDPCETPRRRAHVARLAALWFGRHLGAARRPGPA
jgi:putative phosphoribosyl transferase